MKIVGNGSWIPVVAHFVILSTLFIQFSFASIATELPLTPEERAWLVEHPELTLGTQPDFYPFEFFDNKGNYRGVAADYISLLANRLGIKFNVVMTLNEDERLLAIKSNRIDVVAAVTSASEIKQYMNMTRPHIVIPGVIVSSGEYKNLNALQDKKVAVVAGQQWEKLVSAYSRISLVSVPDTVTGLELTSVGAVDALVGDMATTSYFIHREGMTNLRVVGKLTENLELRIATRYDQPELNSIMEKALATITEDEKAQISRQWIHQKKPSIFQSKTLWVIILVVAAAVLFSLVVIIIWNRTLKRLVFQRTRALNLELQRRRETEIELQVAHSELVNSHQELKETQLQLIHAAKMESVGRLAAGVAHEVKNPLAVIRLGLDYISSEVESKNKHDESAALVQDMFKAVKRADAVINSLLDFSRMDRLDRCMNSINQVVNDSLHLVMHELNHHGIEVQKMLDETLPEINIDANKVQQVFVNLFINAIQAMQDDGILSITTYLKKTQGEDSVRKDLLAGDTVVVEVNDTGPGIEHQSLEKIFDPFYTTKPVGKGTGLGLSVIKNIMDLHDGMIDIKNRETGGLSVMLMFQLKN